MCNTHQALPFQSLCPPVTSWGERLTFLNSAHQLCSRDCPHWLCGLAHLPWSGWTWKSPAQAQEVDFGPFGHGILRSGWILERIMVYMGMAGESLGSKWAHHLPGSTEASSTGRNSRKRGLSRAPSLSSQREVLQPAHSDWNEGIQTEIMWLIAGILSILPWWLLSVLN